MAALGVDVGGSSIKAGVVDLVAGRLVGELIEVDTPQPAPPAVLASAVGDAVGVVTKVDRAEGASNVDPEGAVGCTFPGRLRSGSSLAAVNLHESWVAELLPGTELGEVDVDGRPAQSVASYAAREAWGDGGLDWRTWAENVSRFLQRMQDLVDPQLIIVGGGVSEDPSQLGPALRQPCEVVPAALGNAAGVIGAALFASHSSWPAGAGGRASRGAGGWELAGRWRRCAVDPRSVCR